jgi:type III secretory pathway component EscU
MAVMYFVYKKKRHDLFMLAGCGLSGMVLVVALLARYLLETGGAGGFLFIALVVVGLGAGAAVWLRNVHREWQS